MADLTVVNPKQPPRKVSNTEKWDLAELARTHSAEAVQTLAEIMRSRAASNKDRISAANALLDRGFGKAPQQVNLDAQVNIEPSDAFKNLVGLMGGSG